MHAKLPSTLIPDTEVMKGYRGGKAMYLASWKSFQMLHKFVCNEFVLRYEQFYTPNLN